MKDALAKLAEEGQSFGGKIPNDLIRYTAIRLFHDMKEDEISAIVDAAIKNDLVMSVEETEVFYNGKNRKKRKPAAHSATKRQNLSLPSQTQHVEPLSFAKQIAAVELQIQMKMESLREAVKKVAGIQLGEKPTASDFKKVCNLATNLVAISSELYFFTEQIRRYQESGGKACY